MLKSKSALFVGWFPPGIQENFTQTTTANSKYFAYSSYLNLYVAETNSLTFSFLYSSEDAILTAICLNPVKTDIIAVSFSSKELFIFNIPQQKIISRFLLKNQVYTMCWIEKGQSLMLLSKASHEITKINYEKDFSENTLFFGSSAFDFINSLYINNEEIIVLSNKSGSIMRLEFTNEGYRVLNYNLSKKLVGLHCDSQDGGKVVAITSDGTLHLFDMSEGIKSISVETGKKFGAVTWLLDPPGHFLTGDYDSGILRIWSPSNDTPIKSFKVYQRGLRSIKLISKDRVLCTFDDFFIAIYDLKEQKIIWQIESGHSNTIFVINFHPRQSNVLLSCGGDGVLCAWDISTMKNIVSAKILPDEKFKAISSAVSIDGDFIALGSITGQLGIVSLKTYQTKKIIKVCKLPIRSVSICDFDTNFVSVSFDYKVLIYLLETDEIFRELKTSSNPYSCKFSPHENDTIAVGCGNGQLNIFKGECRVVYENGTDALIAVQWSKTEKDVVYTISSKGTLQKWNVGAEKTDVSNVGFHFNFSHALLPHPTLSNIVALGSNDGSVTIFDSIKNKEIISFPAHMSHVYGLAFSDENPYILITTGRDSSIRIWSLYRLLIKKQVQLALIKGRIPYQPLKGYKELEIVVKRIAKHKPRKENTQHIKDLASSKDNMIKIGVYKKTRETLIEGAKKAAFIGNTKIYCETMFEIGEYDKALAAAPAVSFEYWKELGNRISEAVESKTEKATFQMISGNMEGAAKTFAEMNDFKSATMNISAQLYPSNDIKIEQKQKEVKDKKQKKKKKNLFIFDYQKGPDYREYCVASAAAKEYNDKGEIINAACAFMSIGDVKQAVLGLMKNGELFTALSIDIDLNLRLVEVRETFSRLALSLTKNHKALSFLSGDSLWKVAGSINYSDKSQREKTFDELGIAKPEAKENPSKYESVKSEYIEGDILQVAKDCIQILKSFYFSKEFDFTEAAKYVELLEFIPLSHLGTELLKDVWICSMYFHAFEALWKGFSWPLSHIANEVKKLTETVIWAIPLVQKLEMLNEMIKDYEGCYTISEVGYNYPYPRKGIQNSKEFGFKYVVKDETIARKEILQWLNLTSFNFSPSTQRIYI